MSIFFDGFYDLDNETYSLFENCQKVGWITVNFKIPSIMNVVVENDLRKKGRGTKLVRFVESFALKKGFSTMYTNQINPEARGFFQQCGYQIDPNECGEKKL